MPAKSKQQYKLMKAAENNPEFAEKVGIKPSVAKEFTKGNVNLLASGSNITYANYNNGNTVWIVELIVSGADANYEISLDKGDTWQPYTSTVLPLAKLILEEIKLQI